MRYPQELLAEIRGQNDIVEVIGAYVPLKPKGSVHFGLCPFHHEKTASFSVNREKQFYHCFGCGAGGDVYAFLMQMENCDFVEAVKRLADRVHITLPEVELSPQAKEEERLRLRLFALHKTAGRFYYDTLHTPGGSFALSYLEKRQVHPSIQKKFGLGYAPSGRDSLLTHLKTEGYSISEMLASGLVMENKDKSGYHDRFYDRLMFPVMDIMGRVIGFGGRILKKGEPKYLNSPETLLFHKSQNLYGLHFARQAKKQELILVEGYMDAIALFQAGFRNTAATLGTACNQEHARAITKVAQEVILLYDSDTAGTNAALRAIPVLLGAGLRVKVLQVPDGKDPDDYLKRNGSQAFSKLLLEAMHHTLFEIRCLRTQYDLHNPDHRVRFSTEAAGILAKLPNAIERSVYAKEVARMSGVEETAIGTELSKREASETAAFQKKEQAAQKRYEAAPLPAHAQSLRMAQRDILYWCAIRRPIYQRLSRILEQADFTEPLYQTLFSLIQKGHASGEGVTPAALLDHFENLSEKQEIAALFAEITPYEGEDALSQALNDECRLLKRARIDRMSGKVASAEDLQALLEAKRKLETLYIPISDGEEYEKSRKEGLH